MAIGIFGGTFDPVHIGHLRTALELREHLGLEAMHLMPCGDPAHRAAPLTSAAQRLAMVELAVAGENGLVADDREVRRGGQTWTVDTLIQLRAEWGSELPLCLCIGMDSLVHLNSWKRWRELIELAHIVVAARPGWALPAEGELGSWIEARRIDSSEALHTAPAGSLYIAEMTLLPVAATDLRGALRSGHSIRYLTPDSVIDYIQYHHLYQ